MAHLLHTPISDKTRIDPVNASLFSEENTVNPATSGTSKPTPPPLYGPYNTNTGTATQLRTSKDGEYFFAFPKPQLPPFIKERPDIWFCLIESEFDATNTHTDKAKFSAALKGLDQDTLLQITDLINNPPTDNRYDKLKTAVIERLSDSKHKRVNKLLHELVLGDKKPSQLLREMRDITKDSISDDVLHSMWLSRLPPYIQPLLAASEDVGLNGLAVVADRVIDTGNMANVMAITPSPTTVHANYVTVPQMNRVEQRIEEITLTLTSCLQEITQLKAQLIQKRETRPRSASRTRPNTPDQNGVCYYHRRFGAKATRCTIPCSYQSKAENQ